MARKLNYRTNNSPVLPLLFLFSLSYPAALMFIWAFTDWPQNIKLELASPVILTAILLFYALVSMAYLMQSAFKSPRVHRPDRHLPTQLPKRFFF